MSHVAFETPMTDSVAKIDHELAVGEDLNFQRRWWRFERIAWIIFVLIIVLDLAGAFGRVRWRTPSRTAPIVRSRLITSGCSALELLR